MLIGFLGSLPIRNVKTAEVKKNEKYIFSSGGKQNDDYENLLQAARKAVEFGYKVYLLPNPTEIRTPDLILERKGVYRVYDLKAVFRKSSAGQNLLDSIG